MSLQYKKMAEDTIFKFIKENSMNNVKLYEAVDSELDDDGNTGLIFAAMHGKKEIVKLLIEKGADVKAKNYDGNTALMLAAYNGYKAIVDMLIGAGAEVNMKDNNGWTAIALAKEEGYTEIVDALKNAGAEEEKGDDVSTVTTGQPQSNIVRNKFLLSYEELKKWLNEKPEEKVLNIANEISDLSKLKQIVLDSSQVPSQTVKMELFRGTINVLKIPFFSTYNGWSNWLPSSVEQSLPNVQMFNIDGEDLHIIIQKIPFNFGKDFEVEDNPGKVRMVYRPHFYEYKGEDIKKNSDIQNFFYLKYKIIGDNGDWSTEHIDEIEKLQEMEKMEKKQGGNATILHNWFLIRDETNLSASLNAEQMKDFNKWKDSAIYFRDNWHIHKINNESTLSPAQDEKNQSKSSVLLRDMLRSFNLNKNEGNMVKVYLKHKSVNGDFEGLFIFLRSEDYDNFFIPPLPHLEENHKESGVEESKSDDSDTGENDYKKNPILTSTQQRPPPPRRANNLTRDEAGEERSKSKKSSNKRPPPPAPTPDKRLLTAAKSGNLEGVKRALEADADVKAKNKEGNTALMLASGEGHTEIVKLLEEAVEEKSKEEEKKKKWEENRQVRHNKRLRNAAKSGDLEGVKRALEAGADVKAKNTMGDTALMLASKNGNTEIVKLLIEKGADVNAKDSKGNTALMLASKEQHTEIVNLLKEAVEEKSKVEEKKTVETVKFKDIEIGKIYKTKRRIRLEEEPIIIKITMKGDDETFYYELLKYKNGNDLESNVSKVSDLIKMKYIVFHQGKKRRKIKNSTNDEVLSNLKFLTENELEEFEIIDKIIKETKQKQNRIEIDKYYENIKNDIKNGYDINENPSAYSDWSFFNQIFIEDVGNDMDEDNKKLAKEKKKELEEYQEKNLKKFKKK